MNWALTSEAPSSIEACTYGRSTEPTCRQIRRGIKTQFPEGSWIVSKELAYLSDVVVRVFGTYETPIIVV